MANLESNLPMADPLYLSLWYSSFEADDILPRLLQVLRQFPYSAERPGVTYLALFPVAWHEPTVLEQRLTPGLPPEQAILLASEQLHDDYAYAFEAYWDLWIPAEGGVWSQQPSLVRFTAHGVEFEDGIYQQNGHIQIDFGLDSLFVQEQIALVDEAESRVRANVKKLVDFTTALEKTSGANSRLLWSESEENLAQKLIARLQRVQ
jgi:hypothetical protein